MDEKMPFTPFALDKRERLTSVNTHRHMDFLTTFLSSLNMNKYNKWLQHITYEGLFDINEYFWDDIENSIELEGTVETSKPTKG